MEKRYFLLGRESNNRIINILRVLFALLCIAIGFYWLFLNRDSSLSEGTILISIAFLFGFAFYQIWTATGRATRYIELEEATVTIKKNWLLAPAVLKADNIEKIEFLALCVVFYLKSGKRFLLRFGTTYHETNEKIVDALADFADKNQIPFAIIEENI